jgi:hypothetical protein
MPRERATALLVDLDAYRWNGPQDLPYLRAALAY